MQLTLAHELTELSKVSFCVLDVETTGNDPSLASLTEVAAVRVLGGVITDQYESLIKPGHSIPQQIVALTGISDAIVRNAPSEKEVLPSFLEFLDNSIPVGHNVNFDMRVINAACNRSGLMPVSIKCLDTLSLSRKLLVGEVENFRLGTLSQYLKTYHRPTHRAMSDVLATVDLLHLLIERAGQLGVHHLEDLMTMPSLNKRSSNNKQSLVNKLPHRCGTYLFLDAASTPIYVGKANDIQNRVRSYFGTEQRRKIPALLHRLAKIEYAITPSIFEAEILERRLIRTYQPRFNFQQKHQDLWWISLDEQRLMESSTLDPDWFVSEDTTLFGPFLSKHAARSALRALQLSDMESGGDKLLRQPFPHQELSQNLTSQMHIYAKRQQFERAALLRNDAKTLFTKLATTHLVREICARTLVEVYEVSTDATISAHLGHFNVSSSGTWATYCQESANDRYVGSVLASNGLLKGSLQSVTQLTTLSLAKSLFAIAQSFTPATSNT